jgi:hypothetical protein
MFFPVRAAALAVALLVIPLLAPLEAKTLKLPPKSPVAIIDVPDSWKPDVLDTGFEAVSPDGEIYLSAEFANKDTVDGVIEDTFEYFKKNKIKIDESTRKETETVINGMEVKDFGWKGRDADGPTLVSVSIVTVAPGKVLVLSYWASPAGDKKHSKTVVNMLMSLTPLR